MAYTRAARQRSLRSSPPPANPARFDFPTMHKANQRQFMCEWMFCIYRLRTCRGIASRIIHSTPGQTVDRRRCHKQENGHNREHRLNPRTGRSNRADSTKQRSNHSDSTQHPGGQYMPTIDSDENTGRSRSCDTDDEPNDCPHTNRISRTGRFTHRKYSYLEGH